MSKTIPLIRAGAMIPFMRWMTTHQRGLEQYLNDADLGYMVFLDPEKPIPMRNVARFLVNAARNEGPDIGCRVVSETSVQELALIGRVALGAPTPAKALERIAAALPYHSTHETIFVQRNRDNVVVSEGWRIQLDDVALHVIHQFFCAVIDQLCRLTREPGPSFTRIEMLPHPEFGLTHLEGLLPVPPEAATNRAVRISIDRDRIDRRYFALARDRTGGHVPKGMEPLVGDGSLSNSVKIVLPLHLLDGTPSVDRLAEASGLSRRTLQRLLAAEGTSYSDLLEDVRRQIA